MTDTDCVVVGAGVVGLAVGRELAQRGLETLVLERHSGPGQETSSRNSGVVHSGIYYPSGSLKARLCVRGRALLYDYCAKRDIAHRRCGKLVVAAEHQLDSLLKLRDRGIMNGVDDLEILDPQTVAKLEPALVCAAALWSPSTGIIDVHELMLSLIADLEAAGGTMILHSVVERADVQDEGILLRVRSGGEESELRARYVVNATGLSAMDFVRALSGYPSERVRITYYAKGNYFACHGVRPFKHLVYPMPNNAGLGVHATLDLGGTTRFGPDVEWVEKPDYHVDSSRVGEFYAAIRTYWPAIPAGSLQPAYAGVRPKLVGAGSAPADFEIETESSHGVRGLVNLFGIESPGLTSSLAIGEEVAGLVGV